MPSMGPIDKLQVGAPFLIWLTIAITLRLLLESLARFGFCWLTNPFLLRTFDFLILEWLALLFVMLAILHRLGYRGDERLRSEMLSSQPRNDRGIQTCQGDERGGLNHGTSGGPS